MNFIQHPLHPQHSLTFFQGSDLPWYFICNGCREVKSAICDTAFGCKGCEFYLDLKCAELLDEFFSKHDRQTYENMEKNAKKGHFSHQEHDLKLGCLTEWVVRSCFYCRREVSGYVYCCLVCDFFIHESCMDEMKQEVNHPFHRHRLRANPGAEFKWKSCQACREYFFKDVSLSCDREKCEFHLHYSCAREPFPRPLKHANHQHILYYFGDDKVANDFPCELCLAKDKGALYRCLECAWSKKGNFHVKCISLPGQVKHKSHDCELTLFDSVKGYDSATYYCKICKKAGTSAHHAYRCEECNYIAHIECVISEEIIPNPGFRSDNEAEEIVDENENKETMDSIELHAPSVSSKVIGDGAHGWYHNNCGCVDSVKELRLKVDEFQDQVQKYKNMHEEMKEDFNRIQEELKQMRELLKKSISCNRLTELPTSMIQYDIPCSRSSSQEDKAEENIVDITWKKEGIKVIQSSVSSEDMEMIGDSRRGSARNVDTGIKSNDTNSGNHKPRQGRPRLPRKE